MYGEWYNIDLNPERVIITTGSSGGFILSFATLFDAGDRVGIGSPGYPSYRQILKAQDFIPVNIETELKNKYQPTTEDIKKNDLNGLLVASPANPTGSMLDKTSLTNLIECSKEHNVSFISDEIYHGIEYDKKAISALEITDNCYVINSFSKYFSMTGWRVGWMIVPEDHVRQIEKVSQNLFICPPHASQITALAALDAKDELNKGISFDDVVMAYSDDIVSKDSGGKISASKYSPEDIFNIFSINLVSTILTTFELYLILPPLDKISLKKDFATSL